MDPKTFTIPMDAAKYAIFGKCTEQCRTKDDINQRCEQCKTAQHYEDMTKLQPCESIVMIPTVFYEQGTQFRGLTMYHAIISFYAVVMDMIDFHCNPDAPIPWRDEEWHTQAHETRLLAYTEWEKRRPMLIENIKGSPANHLAIIRSYERYMFTGMAVMEEAVKKESSDTYASRINTNVMKQCTLYLSECILKQTQGRAGFDRYDLTLAATKTWNKNYRNFQKRLKDERYKANGK